MELSEYRADIIQSVKVAATSNGDGTAANFVREISSLLSEDLTDFESCYREGTGEKNKRYRVDGYGFDDSDGTMYLSVADFQGNEDAETLTLTNAKTSLGKLKTFLEEAERGNLINILDISTPAYDLVELLRSNKANIRRYVLVLLTDKISSDRIENIAIENYSGTPIEYGVWDMARIYRKCSDRESEGLIVNFRDYLAEGIPCLEAYSAQTEEYKSFLCVLPGNILANIYDRWGSRLLESNVRSFLSTKVAVNKRIRTTILTEPKNFFAYNNGIAATATDVVIEQIHNLNYITEIHGLQIVNGGQTTASLSNARYKDKANLEGIYVQMKLTKINAELASIIVPNISRSSNSQNKVTEADFFSNHQFHIRMEKISRRINAPSIGGAQYDTHWFYERARGQYLQEQSKLSKAEKNQFLLRNPKHQLIKTTELAQVMNLWEQLPHKVSYGTQKNFAVFAVRIADEWDRNETNFNDLYFKHVVALIIIFRHMEKMIPKQAWYDKGYRAQIIYHSLAKLSYDIQKYFPGRKLDLDNIWSRQAVPDILTKQLMLVAEFVYEILTDPHRPIQNVTEWSKREACWTRVQEKYIQPASGFEEILIGMEESREKSRDAWKKQKMVSGIEAQTQVNKLILIEPLS